MKFKVHVFEIDYDITAEDLIDYDLPENADEEIIQTQIDQLKAGLPQDLVVEIDAEEGDDLSYLVCEAISNETGWCVNWFAGEEVEE